MLPSRRHYFRAVLTAVAVFLFSCRALLGGSPIISGPTSAAPNKLINLQGTVEEGQTIQWVVSDPRLETTTLDGGKWLVISAGSDQQTITVILLGLKVVEGKPIAAATSWSIVVQPGGDVVTPIDPPIDPPIVVPIDPPLTGPAKVAKDAIVGYSTSMAAAFENIATQLETGVLKKPDDTFKSLEKLLVDSSDAELMKPIQTLIESEVGGTKWNPATAASLFRKYAEGMKAVK